MNPTPSNLSQETFFGKTITVKGSISGDEKLVVYGIVEGEIHIKNDLEVSQNGVVKANVEAMNVTVAGTLTGTIVASDKVEISNAGVVAGEIRAPRFVICDGGNLNGKIEMGTPQATAAAKSKAK